MSTKREDDLPADMEAGMTTAERRRRRRRGGGLRVPSDNVPRRSGSQSAITPLPEDPNLAVSIAYSFATDASGPMPRQDEGDLDSAPVMAADAVPSQMTEIETALPPLAARRPATIPPPVAAEARPWSDESLPDIKVESSPEIAIDQFESEEPLEAAPVAPLAGDIVADGKTREMSAVNLEALGLSMPGQGDDDGEATEFTPPPVAPRASAAASVAVATGSSDPDTTSERPAASAASARPANDVGEASVDIEMDEEAEAVPISRTYRRTTTVALSEEDLEELMEAEASEARSKARAGSPDAVALADDDLKDEVQQPADAADSGEILTEDLIEEVDAQSAKVKAPAAAQAAPAPAPAPVATPAPAAAPVVAATPAAPRSRPRTLDGMTPVPDSVPAPAATPTPPPAPAENGAPAVAKPPPAPKKEKAAARAAAVAAAALPSDKKKKKGKPWFEEIFDEDYLRTLPFLTPQATQAEARFVIDALAVEPGAQVLDLGCGYGRHAMELAARGYHVVGLDMSLPLLLRGADEAQRRGLTINFVHGDMRELDFDAQFDGAYCLFSTFGFFDDETNKKTAANLSRALKPGAKAIIEILNRDYLVGDLPTRVWWEGDGCVVLEEVEFNYFSSRIQSARSVVFDDGRQLEQEISIRAYSLHELGKLLHAVGFRVLEVSGSIQTRGRFFGTHSRQIFVVAERRATTGKDTLDSTRG